MNPLEWIGLVTVILALAALGCVLVELVYLAWIELRYRYVEYQRKHGRR